MKTGLKIWGRVSSGEDYKMSAMLQTCSQVLICAAGASVHRKIKSRNACKLGLVR